MLAMRWQRRNDQSHKWMQQISTEGVYGETRLGRQGDPLGNVQEISVRPYKPNGMCTTRHLS